MKFTVNSHGLLVKDLLITLLSAPPLLDNSHITEILACPLVKNDLDRLFYVALCRLTWAGSRDGLTVLHL